MRAHVLFLLVVSDVPFGRAATTRRGAATRSPGEPAALPQRTRGDGALHEREQPVDHEREPVIVSDPAITPAVP